jgi:thiol-disulfide isomerase/thioredoxin
LDYSDNRLYKSGLFKDALESHFWLLENSGLSLDSVYIEMKISIDAMFLHLLKDEKKLNEITDFLFDLLERHSLFRASEYLALKALNERSCTINSNLASQLETYRAMKIGNTAADFPLTSHLFLPKGFNLPATAMMSRMISKYLVVVFGASWCPKCKEELPEMVKHYSDWKANGVEVLFVSLDMDKDVYYNFVKDLPFPSVCDLKKWDGEVVTKYYVFGTPTMFLIDKDRKIVLRPNSVNQIDAWVDWYLLKGNSIRK